MYDEAIEDLTASEDVETMAAVVGLMSLGLFFTRLEMRSGLHAV